MVEEQRSFWDLDEDLSNMILQEIYSHGVTYPTQLFLRYLDDDKLPIEDLDDLNWEEEIDRKIAFELEKLEFHGLTKKEPHIDGKLYNYGDQNYGFQLYHLTEPDLIKDLKELYHKIVKRLRRAA